MNDYTDQEQLIATAIGLMNQRKFKGAVPILEKVIATLKEVEKLEKNTESGFKGLGRTLLATAYLLNSACRISIYKDDSENAQIIRDTLADSRAGAEFAISILRDLT
ncbi:hypothetical protein F4054_13565 [Candidatus Poribacteria bacterium]|nr:hypothetical protein [Candidatus Poribacteria bacterium]MYF54164.1 hypothetical protein [Gammaproteobacteria bacterium]MYK23273.1 hypothetical protein [Candidatus Poribacteria bacterium]